MEVDNKHYSAMILLLCFLVFGPHRDGLYGSSIYQVTKDIHCLSPTQKSFSPSVTSKHFGYFQVDSLPPDDKGWASPTKLFSFFLCTEHFHCDSPCPTELLLPRPSSLCEYAATRWQRREEIQITHTKLGSLYLCEKHFHHDSHQDLHKTLAAPAIIAVPVTASIHLKEAATRWQRREKFRSFIPKFAQPIIYAKNIFITTAIKTCSATRWLRWKVPPGDKGGATHTKICSFNMCAEHVYLNGHQYSRSKSFAAPVIILLAAPTTISVSALFHLQSTASKRQPPHKLLKLKKLVPVVANVPSAAQPHHSLQQQQPHKLETSRRNSAYRSPPENGCAPCSACTASRH